MKLLSRLFGATPDAPETAPAADQTASSEVARIETIGNLPAGPELWCLAGHGPVEAERQPSPSEQRAAQARLAQLIDDGSVDVAALRPGQQGFLVVNGATSRVRQLAAESVHEAGQLRELLKQVRAKDKSVYKILKQKLDLLQAHDREAAQIVAEIDSICAALERHSHRPFDPLYIGVFEHHHHRWLGLTNPPDDAQRQRATEAVARCKDVIAEHARSVAPQADREAALAAAREAQRIASAAAEAEAAANRQAEAHQQELAAAARAASDAADAERLAIKLAAEQQVSRQIGGLLRKANSALTEGQSQAAAGLRRAIDEKMAAAAAAGTTVPGHFIKSIQQLDDRLDELKQWKSFAVGPKRAELIRDMQSLIGSTEEPKVLAGKIKALQEDWKTVSKGIVSDGSEDWESFHKASQAAYQPCREYFEAQSKLRQANLERRQTVLKRVLAFEENIKLETLDWRLLTRVLREAPLEWRSHSPVERDAARSLQAEFDASLARLQAILDAWYQRNGSDKQALIEAARQLVNLEDGRAAVEAVKQLQARWKEIGPAARRDEQLLWRGFREHCDAVFQKRQQAHAQYSALLEASTAQAAALCAQIEESAGQTGAALSEASAKVPDWRTAFEALGELPRGEARGLQRRFEQAISQLEAKALQQRAREAEQSVTDVFDASRRIRACEWAALQEQPESLRAALREEAQTFLAGMKRGPAGANQALKDALAKADAVSNVDLQAREKALRILCIRCEILRDAATPAEDEALRREYQVQRLMQGLGQGHTGAPDWNAMLVEWIRISAISPPEHEKLQGRFMRIWLENAADVKRAAEPPRRERQQSRVRS